MITISLCMIVKDEEAVLSRCLDSVADVVDEIIIVDTGSCDRTKEIASRYTDKVYDFFWIDDFSAARNFSFSFAAKDYILWLDADDVLLPEDREKLLLLKRTLSADTDIVMMRYNIAFDKNGLPTYSYYRERLLKRSKNYRWQEPVHEVITPEGNVVYQDICVSHKTEHKNEGSTDGKRNLRIVEKKLAEGYILSPRLKFYYARELYYNAMYARAAEFFEDFLASEGAWVENCISACQDLAAVYYSLGEEDRALQTLLRSFYYAAPRAEVCCALGQHFFDKWDYRTAIFWYEAAAAIEPDISSGGFYSMDYYGYIPFMQLCLCYDRLGERQKAVFYHERAAALKPDEPAVIYNQKYFFG